jgi:predicted O-linked N-acetylglucosamine transferase (SPINDLY family)
MNEHYKNQFRELRVDPKRIHIVGWKNPVEHMRLYGKIDIALDTFPYNGCMTTMEGLWMGVPTISLVGDAISLSRSGLSILSRVGLEFFAASTTKEYVSKAAALARNLDSLEKIHNTLRQRMAASTLCDASRFAREMEAAYRMMWRRWCKSGHDVVRTDGTGRNLTSCSLVKSTTESDSTEGNADGPAQSL